MHQVPAQVSLPIGQLSFRVLIHRLEEAGGSHIQRGQRRQSTLVK